ncbi:MAG: tetratricopeptide repeat protein, partial [Gammaproteobacteria bacterium]|nr:tetratricopeptide repeat protein [Gammaproteobacteria bacterium]
VAHPENPALPGRWAERNIGCEACHGAGARHTESLEKADIVKNPSSRVCGQCHTTVGKILPKGELHDTHDLLQIWNQDRHVTGVRRHSHNAFCSSCHSPYDGHTLESGLDAGRKVFTEQKLNITCIGCHDPHAVTHSAYQREAVSLELPLTIRSHSFEGNDNDFTTTDHREWDSAAESCLRCHRGADRVDLDHANATCVDCHNTYKRNHSRESRQFHDSNQPGLSCLGCHQDADYLMSILYGDPDFLEPRHIHNLRTLPAMVRERYGFRYAALRRPDSVVRSQPVAEADDAEAKPGASPALTPAISASSTTLRDLLDREAHARLAGHASIKPLRDALLAAPGSPIAHLGLAQAYADLGELTMAREILNHASRLDSSRLLLELPFLSSQQQGTARQAGNDEPASTDVRARVAALLPESAAAEDDAVRTWLHSYTELTLGNFDAVVRVLNGAANSAATGLYRSLAEYGAGNYRHALKLLEANIETWPAHHSSRAALGLMHLNRKRSAPAQAAFERAISIAPSEGSARLLLGLARIASGDLEGAVQSYREAIEVEPSLIAARFLMAHAYQLGGRPDAAALIYDEIIELEPRLFEARYALANVLKLLSDEITFRLRDERESNPPGDMRLGEWKSRHSQWQQQVDKYRNRALTELAVAVQLRPGALDATRQVAEIYRGSNRLDEARRFYQRLIELEPEIWLHRYRLGTIWFALGDYKQAVNELTRVTVMAPTDGDAYLALGLALVRANRLDDAIAVFEKATTYEPFNPGLYTNLGAAYANRGDLSKAQAAFERSLELHSF